KAPVPADTEFVGVRFAVGTFLTAVPVPSVVDGFVDLPLRGRIFQLEGRSLRPPGFDDAEDLVDFLVREGLLLDAATSAS
ncbi:hypothetical protein SB782_37575, partial [Brevibacillus sp. SIMBA_076]